MNTISPKLSVIVPVYKVEQYLPKCIDSILAQSFTDFELLLINDGSPDNSGNICKAYAAKDTRIHVFHKTNGGVSSARNLGLDNAKGEWIIFIDADDWIKPIYFERIHDIAKKVDPDIIEIGTTKCLNLYNESKDKDLQLFYTLNQYIEKINRATTCYAYVYKKEIIENIRFTIGVRLGEDQEFAAKALLNSRILAYTSSIYYFYFTRENSAMNSKMEYSDLDGLRMIQEIDKFNPKLDKKNINKYIHSLYNSRIKSYIYFLSNYPLNNTIYKKAQSDFRKVSLKNTPTPFLLRIAQISIRFLVLLFILRRNLKKQHKIK